MQNNFETTNRNHKAYMGWSETGGGRPNATPQSNVTGLVRVRVRVASLDKNGDGEVTVDEFREALAKDHVRGRRRHR